MNRREYPILFSKPNLATVRTMRYAQRNQDGTFSFKPHRGGRSQ